MTINLTTEEKEFFNKVASSVFSNPFSHTRESLDKNLSGIDNKNHLNTHRKKAISKVQDKIRSYDKNCYVNLKNFNADDKNIMRYVFLYDIFHQYLEQFDQLIIDQINSKNKSIEVTFADDTIKLLQTRGFNKAESLWFFSSFFQLRRAFYFISRTIIGCSDSMRKLRSDLWNNVFSVDMMQYEKYLFNQMEDFSTLILGSTGTGKGVAAQAIGKSGFIPFNTNTNSFEESFMNSFVSINISQFSRHLIESELFGHKKGSFTGAIDNNEGIFSKCSQHGAIFLDEIGEISTNLQIKLLKVLQERVFTPVGSRVEKRFSGRVIAATNQSISNLRKNNRFRHDFFYRLCSDIIELPTLHTRIKENSNELKDLTFYITDKITGKSSPELSSDILKTIIKCVGKDYAWPGNVRELEQAIRRILLQGKYEGDSYVENQNNAISFTENIDNGAYSANELLSLYCQKLYEKHKTFEEVAKITQLDRRTVKKYILSTD